MLTFLVASIVGLYTTFVLTILWGWFVVPALHVPGISFCVAYGLVLLVGLLRSSSDFETEHRHNILAAMINACIPAEQRGSMMEQLEELEQESWSKVGWMIFGQSSREYGEPRNRLHCSFMCRFLSR